MAELATPMAIATDDTASFRFDVRDTFLSLNSCDGFDLLRVCSLHRHSVAKRLQLSGMRFRDLPCDWTMLSPNPHAYPGYRRVRSDVGDELDEI